MKKKKTDEQPKPSLLENASRGGDTNEGGISFQAAVIMSHIPRWMAMDGFTSMVREAMFDGEAKFFVPGRNFVKEAIEVKDHLVTPKEFWEEIDRFQQVDAGSPGSYQWFTLACTGLSESLHPLVNGLRRLRGPYGFYQDDSTILGNTYREYVQKVEQLERTEDDAAFLYQRVLLQGDLSLNRAHGKAVFKQELNEQLPYHQDIPDRVLEDIHAHLGVFIQSRRNKTITRQELEHKLEERVPANLRPAVQPVRLFTAIDDADPDFAQMHFAWAPFFGGIERNHPPSEVWNERLLGELRETKNWILKHRGVRRVLLDGNRRLSTSVAIGFVFSAVAGFNIDMVNRGEMWSTDAHASNDTPSYELFVKEPNEEKTGARLVVSIGIPREIVAAVEEDMENHGLADMPALHIHGVQPILSPQQLNRAVWEIKTQIARSLIRTKAKQVDLFIAGPAPLALFLGHRMNATATIQCYEQSGTGGYVPTCRLA